MIQLWELYRSPHIWPLSKETRIGLYAQVRLQTWNGRFYIAPLI